MCGMRFRYCEHCWRGHKYCSSVCSIEGRKKSRRKAEQKYASSPKGRESRRRRQKNFRIRCILRLTVTDHSPRHQENIIKINSNFKPHAAESCRQCQRAVLAINKNLNFTNESNFFSFVRFKINRQG